MTTEARTCFKAVFFGTRLGTIVDASHRKRVDPTAARRMASGATLDSRSHQQEKTLLILELPRLVASRSYPLCSGVRAGHASTGATLSVISEAEEARRPARPRPAGWPIEAGHTKS